MTPEEELARWRQWAFDVAGSQVCPGEVWRDDDLRQMVIAEQEQRACRLLASLKLVKREYEPEPSV